MSPAGTEAAPEQNICQFWCRHRPNCEGEQDHHHHRDERDHPFPTKRGESPFGEQLAGIIQSLQGKNSSRGVSPSTLEVPVRKRLSILDSSTDEKRWGWGISVILFILYSCITIFTNKLLNNCLLQASERSFAVILESLLQVLLYITIKILCIDSILVYRTQSIRPYGKPTVSEKEEQKVVVSNFCLS